METNNSAIIYENKLSSLAEKLSIAVWESNTNKIQGQLSWDNIDEAHRV